MTNTTTTQGPSKLEEVSGKTRDVAGAAGKRATAVATTAKDEATSVAEDARHQAKQLASQSRDQLRLQADEQARRLVDTLRDVGDQLSDMGRGESAPSGAVADFTQQAASSVHRMAQTLDEKGPSGVVADVKTFARQRPGLFVLGALGAGVVAGRLIRSLDTGAVAQAAKPSNEPDNGAEASAPQFASSPMPAAGSFEAGVGNSGTALLNQPKEF
jgi:hypothetical protein